MRVEALATIQQAASAADERDLRKTEVASHLLAIDITLQELASALGSIESNSETLLEQELSGLNNPVSNFAPIDLAERLRRVFKTYNASHKLVQSTRDARSLLSRALATSDPQQISEFQSAHLARLDKIDAFACGLPTTGGFEFLPTLIGTIHAVQVIFDLHSRTIESDFKQSEDLELAAATLRGLADGLSVTSADFAAASTTSILSGVENIRWALATGAAAIIVMICIISLMTRRLVIRPSQRSAHVLAELGPGRHADPPPQAALKELNTLGGAVAKFANALRSMTELQKQKSAAEEEEERNSAMRQEMRALANEFESTVMASVSQIGKSAGELRQSSDFMSDAIKATKSLSHSSRDRAAEAR